MRRLAAIPLSHLIASRLYAISYCAMIVTFDGGWPESPREWLGASAGMLLFSTLWSVVAIYEVPICALLAISWTYGWTGDDLGLRAIMFARVASYVVPFVVTYRWLRRRKMRPQATSKPAQQNWGNQTGRY